MLNRNRLNKIDHLIKQLFQEKDKWISLAIAVDLADEIMKGILPDNPTWQSQLTRNVQETGELPRPLASDVFRTQKQIAWFHEHPESASARIALKHFWAEDCAIESHFFWINDSATKQKISASTELTPNWEDSDLTRRPDYKVGIDFFLTKEADALLMVISNKQRLKVMELKEKLSNTQKLLFEKNLNGAAAYTGIENGVRLEFEPQRTIHATIWNALEIKEVNRDFYRGIAALFEELVAHLTKSGKDKDNAKQFSSRLIGRLLFIWFLRKMDLINEQVDYFNTTGMTATKYYASKLKLLFFETLNTLPEKRTHDLITPFLNGGLFDFKENDYRHEEVEFPDGYFQRMYAHFEQFNFTTDESSSDFELIAVDPEMLGQVFEELLASQLNETGANERNRTGSFYTPREIVDYMCKETLRHYLYNKINNPIFNDGIDSLLDLSDSQFLNRKSTSQADLWGVNSRDVISNIIKSLNEFKVLDPACGSGAFPMGMLQLLLRTYERIDKRFDPYKLKLSIIENNLYGVDIQPMAVEISRLRAWLSVIVEEQDKTKVHALPNLDFKFISANSLVNLKNEETIFAKPGLEEDMANLREKYFNARLPERKQEIQSEYYELTACYSFDQRDERTEQLQSFDPFKNRTSASFFDSRIMFGIQDGFDAVIGNPPYIHFEKMDKADREFHKELGYETYAARGDIYTLFYERGIQLLKEKGILTFITSNKWLRAQYGKNLRNFFLKKSNPLLLIDLGAGRFTSATVDTNVLVTEKSKNRNQLQAVTFAADSLNNMRDYIKQNQVGLSVNSTDSWIVVSPIEHGIKTKIESVGIPLSKWNIKINYGIKTGCNDAFIIDENTRQRLIKEDPKGEKIIRPILRGRDIFKNSFTFKDFYVITAWFGSHKILENEYPSVYMHLKQFEKQLKNRGQVRYSSSGSAQTNKDYPGQHHWLELDNNPSLEKLEEFSKRKIVYREISNEFNACIVPENILINNKCYMITGNHLEYLVTILNSKLFNKIVLSQANLTGGKGPNFMRQISIPLPDPVNEKKIIKLHDERENAKPNRLENIDIELDRIVCNIFNLNEIETNFIIN